MFKLISLLFYYVLTIVKYAVNISTVFDLIQLEMCC